MFLTLSFNPDDIIPVLRSMQTELIILGVALVLAIVASLVVGKKEKPARKFARGTTWIAFALVLIMVVNMILSGPMFSIVNMALNPDVSGNISEESINEASELCTDIAEEGIILLKNEGSLPLAKGTKLNTFGWSATNPIYGGVGSGALSQEFPIVSFLEGLTNAGLEYNTDLTGFYTNWRAARPSVGMWAQDWTIPEPTQDEYAAAGVYENALAYSDTAIFFVARSGGEGADLPVSYYGDYNAEGMSGASGMSEYPDDMDPEKHYLELSNRERATLEALNSKFDNIIVIINCAAAMEMGFIEEYENITAAVYVPGGPGQNGFNALGSILVGDVNPSGKTVDTIIYDLKQSPTWNNFGATYYTNLSDIVGAESKQPSYVGYVEGIYVGYKFYETAADEGLINYEQVVQYPFGYGMTYTTFEQTMGEIKESNGTLSVDVTVKNTGSVAGRDVIQLYFNPPYTNGGIEKATANLVAFDKTDIIEPGKEATYTLTWKVEDMASYDTYGHGCYVVEKGDYIISINADSHNIIAEAVYTVAEDIVYNESNPRSTDAVAATNQFAFAENLEQFTYLSRKDGFANYAVATAAPTFTEMSAEHKAGFWTNNNYNPADWNNPDDVAPTLGVDAGLTMLDMRGVAYDDPKWETFLSQMSVQDMVTLISVGGYQSTVIDSIGKTQQIDCDGPASINNNFTGKGSIGFTSAVMIASTWNEDIAHRFGESIGQMADEMNVSGWYAPAMNNHRTAFSGRNFEYYSEDGFLGGKMAANAVAGAETHGVYSFMKHFALNDQETNRSDGLCTWSNEQAIREIYLKPFEMAVKEGGADAAMSAFNHIGNEYAGACNELLINVLRGEWGFKGMVLTDYFMGGLYQDADIQIRNGNDFCLSPMGGGNDILGDQTSATSLLAARQACKNILYVTANSRAYSSDVLNPGMPTWQILTGVISLALAALLVLWELKKYKKYKATK